LDACLQTDRVTVSHTLQVAKKDEDKHVSYTREAVYQLLPRQKADEVMAIHRAVEARANLVFSQKQVRVFLDRFATTIPRRRQLLYRVCAILMESAGAYV
jgi:hypothetical protein